MTPWFPNLRGQQRSDDHTLREDPTGNFKSEEVMVESREDVGDVPEANRTML